jgi:hypothetical protein
MSVGFKEGLGRGAGWLKRAVERVSGGQREGDLPGKELLLFFLNKIETKIFAHMHESFQWLPPSTRRQGGEGLL